MNRLWLIAVLALTACPKKAPVSNDAGADSAAPAPPAPVDAAPPLPTESAVETEAHRVTDAWNAAMNAHDLAALEKVYAKRLELYATSVTRAQAIVSKRAAFAKTPTFEQSIADFVLLPADGDGWRARFTKQSGPHGHLSSTHALLDFGFEDGKLVIVRESDEPSEIKALSPPNCRQDSECGPGRVCTFIAGDTWVCSAIPAPETCPKGEIFLPRVGGCWQSCDTDKDCPEHMCCSSDPNAPQPICMGRCF